MTTADGSTPAVLELEGAPRDLGLDQGRACAEILRDRSARTGGRGDWLGRWRPYEGPRALARAENTARDVRRHFPHLDERVIGLSRGADVSELALHLLLARELGPDAESAKLAVSPAAGGGLAVVSPEAMGVVRRARPDAYYPSVEWTLPWLPGALAGVNAGGLAVAARSPGPGADETCAAPAFLLLQNCLHQFDSVEGAAEWCLCRPAGGRAELLLADRSGARAAIVIDGAKRSQVEPPEPRDAAAPGAAAVRLSLDPAAGVLEWNGQRIAAPAAD